MFHVIPPDASRRVRQEILHCSIANLQRNPFCENFSRAMLSGMARLLSVQVRTLMPETGFHARNRRPASTSGISQFACWNKFWTFRCYYRLYCEIGAADGAA
jgi:hypothetical protein